MHDLEPKPGPRGSERIDERVTYVRYEPRSLLARVVATIVAVLLLVAAFFVSLVVFSILLTAGALFLAYALWTAARQGRDTAKGRWDGEDIEEGEFRPSGRDEP